MVSLRSDCIGARNTASIAPTMIIGIPMPIEICFETIRYALIKNLYEFYENGWVENNSFNPNRDHHIGQIFY